MIVPPTTQEIYDNLVARLRDEAGLSVDSPSSISSAMAVGFSTAIADLWAQLAQFEKASNLDLATGSDLDRLGKFMGVTRKGAKRATTEGYGPALVFQNTSAAAIVVPQGTLVFASKNPSVTFQTRSNITVPANSSQSVDVLANDFGPQYNVGQFALNAHNLGITALKVYNPRAITSGSDTESDDSYRSRLFASINDKNPSSRQSIEQSLSQLPGVRSARLLDNASGPGTFDLLLEGDSVSVPIESITEAQNYLALYAPLGISYRVITPDIVPVDVSIQLILTPENEGERKSIIEAVRQAISDFFVNLPVEDGSGNGSFFYSGLLTSIAYVFAKVQDYTIDIAIDDIPIAFGMNYNLSIREQFAIRKIVVR